MNFHINNSGFSAQLSFLITEINFVKNFKHDVFERGINIIKAEYEYIEKEEPDLISYTYAVNEELRYNLIKSTFFFIFSQYESSLHMVIKKLMHLKEGKDYPRNKNDIKSNLNKLSLILEVKYINYTNELSELKKIRDIVIHRNGRLLPEEYSFSKNLEILNGKNKNCAIAVISEHSHYLKLEEEIINFACNTISNFYKNIIGLAEKLDVSA